MDPKTGDQQPIARTIGRRTQAPAGSAPSAAARAAWDAMAAHRTCVPKGVIRYSSHEDMVRDRDAWTAEAMAQRARARA